MKVSQLLRQVARDFARAGLHFGHGTHTAREEAAWLVSSILGFLLEQELDKKQVQQILGLARQRIRTRKPLAYLLHEAWLGEQSFYVDERVIVPRSFIAEMVRERFAPWLKKAPRTALDLCTGSSCLAILLALEFPRAKVDAADVSTDALAVARKNVLRYELSSRVKLIKSNLFSHLKTYDLIVSNPPYVTAASMRKLPPEYRREPKLALAAGKDGLDLVHQILADARRHLNPRGMLVCEIGGNRRALERAWPGVEFAWPEVSDPGTVFVLQREQLPRGARSAPALRIAATRPSSRG